MKFSEHALCYTVDMEKSIRYNEREDVMTVKEYILKCPETELADELFKMLELKNRKAFDSAFEKLLAEIATIIPIVTNDIIKGELIDNGEIDATLHVVGDSEAYSLLLVEWEKILGYSIDEESIEKCGRAELAAAVLCEMTFFSSTAEENRKYVEETQEAIEESRCLFRNPERES